MAPLLPALDVRARRLAWLSSRTASAAALTPSVPALLVSFTLPGSVPVSVVHADLDCPVLVPPGLDASLDEVELDLGTVLAGPLPLGADPCHRCTSRTLGPALDAFLADLHPFAVLGLEAAPLLEEADRVLSRVGAGELLVADLAALGSLRSFLPSLRRLPGREAPPPLLALGSALAAEAEGVLSALDAALRPTLLPLLAEELDLDPSLLAAGPDVLLAADDFPSSPLALSLFGLWGVPSSLFVLAVPGALPPALARLRLASCGPVPPGPAHLAQVVELAETLHADGVASGSLTASLPEAFAAAAALAS